MDKSLRYFMQVAEQGSFSQAAKQLHLSQPSLTHHISKLEQRYGTALFIRRARGVSLTAAGEVLEQKARMMQRLAEQAAQEIAQLNEHKTYSLRFGSGHAWWYAGIDKAVERYRQRYPSAQLHAEIGNNLTLASQLLSGQIRFFIGHEIQQLRPSLGLQFERLFESERRYYVRQHHPQQQQTLTPSDLSELTRLEVTPLDRRYSELLAHLPPSPQQSTVFSSNSLSVIVDLLSQSDAYLMYPAEFSQTFAKQGITTLTVIGAEQRANIGLYTLDDVELSQAESSLLGLIREAITPRG